MSGEQQRKRVSLQSPNLHIFFLKNPRLSFDTIVSASFGQTDLSGLYRTALYVLHTSYNQILNMQVMHTLIIVDTTALCA